MLSKLNQNKKSIFSLILLFAGNFLFFLTLWLAQKYEVVYLDQFLYQMKTSAAGVHRALAGSAFVRVGVFFLVTSLVELQLYRLLSGRAGIRLARSERYARYRSGRVSAFFRRSALPLSALGLALCAGFFAVQMDVLAYADRQADESDFIQEHYITPTPDRITFPEQKRNLVYIFLESMEATFSDPQAGPPIQTDYIPNLSRLARDHVSFSHDLGPGGALSFAGTTWTASAMVAQTAGVPVKVPLGADTYGDDAPYMPGLVSLGEILDQAGYNQTVLMGSDGDFHGRKPYFELHGGYNVLDINALKEQGRLDEDYRIWWGFEDAKLYEYARQEATRLSQEQAPFNLTLLTADTHFPDGLPCHLCPDTHDNQYADVLSCADRQVYDFVCWLQEQPFWPNTTVVISGDHLTMDADFLAGMNEDYTRTVYNCFLNAPVAPIRTVKRQFGTFDLFPTTLAALGARIEGNRLALGTDLFSPTPTLTERFGFEVLNTELQKGSAFYNTKILGMEE